jgi:hypothetical protein
MVNGIIGGLWYTYPVNDVQTGLKNGGSMRVGNPANLDTPSRSSTELLTACTRRISSTASLPTTARTPLSSPDPISKKYFSVGGYTSVLGFPTEYRDTTGLRNGGATKTFERGAIVWSPANGAFVSKGAIRAAWLKTGAQNGKLGYPITDEITFSGGVKQYFEGGVIVWTAKTGAAVTLVPPHTIR